jgi:hypothetical protein
MTMTLNKTVLLVAVATMSLAAGGQAALAQRGGGGGGGGGVGGSGGFGGAAGSLPSTSGRGDTDRLRDRDRLDTPDRDRLRDRDRTTSPDRDRDRLRTDQALRDQLSSWSLLTSQERAGFHQQMQQATTAQQRQQIRDQARNTINERARELGANGAFGQGNGAAGAQNRYLMSLMLTDQERLQFHQQMAAATTEQERQRIRSQHQAMIRERAQEMGLDLPAGFGGGPNGG